MAPWCVRRCCQLERACCCGRRWRLGQQRCTPTRTWDSGCFACCQHHSKYHGWCLLFASCTCSTDCCVCCVRVQAQLGSAASSVAHRALLAARYFGDSHGVQLWTTALHMLQQQPTPLTSSSSVLPPWADVLRCAALVGAHDKARLFLHVRGGATATTVATAATTAGAGTAIEPPPVPPSPSSRSRRGSDGECMYSSRWVAS